jgi:DNA replicative helicase MCM subunit Mcm2 (Cdc46/Mcm family)
LGYFLYLLYSEVVYWAVKSRQIWSTSALATNGNVIDLLVSKFAPSVIGHEHVKKGLLLCAANFSTLNSSIKSLIAVVTQEEDHYMLRLGRVPAASGAICAINEIGRMNYEDQAGFLDAMQEGKIPFGKYGFNITLDGSATFIMSANPTNNSSWRNAARCFF